MLAAAATTTLPEALGSFTFGSSGLRRGEDGAHHFTITTGNTTAGPGLRPMSAEVGPTVWRWHPPRPRCYPSTEPTLHPLPRHSFNAALFQQLTSFRPFHSLNSR
jgi:hypothetical protein